MEDENEVVALWHRCELVRPHNPPYDDIHRKLQVDPQWFLVGTINNRVIATIMVGYEGRRGWINYLAVDPKHRRQGCGRKLMEEAEHLMRQVGCPKINLQVLENNPQAVAFYESLGYRTDPVISMGKRLT